MLSRTAVVAYHEHRVDGVPKLQHGLHDATIVLLLYSYGGQTTLVFVLSLNLCHESGHLRTTIAVLSVPIQ